MAGITCVAGVKGTVAMAVKFSCRAPQHYGVFTAPVCCRDGVISPRNLSYDAGCRNRTTFGDVDTRWMGRATTGLSSSLACPLSLAAIQNPAKQHYHKIVAHGGRALLYDDVLSYVLMEPGEDEQFVTQEELQAKLKSWLVKWPENDLPHDLTHFESLDEVVTYLVDSACELNLGGGRGSLQWYQIRLET